jgi:hypothetical protein
VELAVHTGIHWRHWLDDPPAMITALEVMAEHAAEISDTTRPGR